VLETNRRVAEALDVPLALLTLWIYGGFTVIAVGGLAEVAALGWLSVLFGLGTLGAGLRAVLRPARPFAPGVEAMERVLSDSRRLGAFYALVGVIWLALSVTVISGP
jgi:hypothetical protein